MSCDSATLHSINYVIGLYRDTLHSFIRICIYKKNNLLVSILSNILNLVHIYKEHSL